MKNSPTLDEALLEAFHRLGQEMHARVERLHDQAIGRLTLQHVRALRFLNARQTCTMSELARELRITKASTTVLIKHLEKQQLVERSPDDHDRRLVHLKPTATMLRHLARIMKQKRQAMESMLAPLSKTEKTHLLKTLKKLNYVLPVLSA